MIRVVRGITNNKIYKASCDKALSCRRETVVDSQGNSVWEPGIVFWVGWVLVGKKWHRLFLVGGPGEAGGGKVLQSAAEPEHQA